MKLSIRSLFAVLALAAAMGTMTFGCSKPADETPTAPTGANAPAKPDAGGGAAPPKTHD